MDGPAARLGALGFDLERQPRSTTLVVYPPSHHHRLRCDLPLLHVALPTSRRWESIDLVKAPAAITTRTHFYLYGVGAAWHEDAALSFAFNFVSAQGTPSSMGRMDVRSRSDESEYKIW